MTLSDIDVDVDDLEPRKILHPHHSWETAKRVIQKACAADEHDWVELSGAPNAYWRECRNCRIADVTAAALGQDVETPNDNRENGR